ncbi:YdcF family protein [Herbaspirillum seropedicae]|uniref:YdcF family protein n=1 Tax=Herbaspirillum seropedicae TaxID=964 RepID=UPI000847F8C1|nr:YdcF family protein [Herbaspirillum seropedicae]AON54536.1 hypothetical protein Hsc_2251 [Herbaspirillum seropedicae]MDR6394417.1 uncharacterized SAM-binding protein YcdF (DUF218 family) [Herbaspirillum seropedicae]
MNSSTPARYDALIVLANEMDINGRLNEESAARADLAARLAQEGEIGWIVTSGWAYRADTDICIADAFKDYLMSVHGIAPARILTEVGARDTVGDAVFTRSNAVAAHGWRRLCVVTSDYHVARTQAVFNFVYGPDFVVDVRGAAVGRKDGVEVREAASIAAFRATFEGVRAGAIADIMTRLGERHPFYNGEIYSQI